jgi:energy-coupling factor transporter ATP-binding protein EcfA2
MLVHHASLARQRAQLVATGVHVERSGRPVLTELSLAVTRGMRLGIVGENGRGKSTRLQVLAGALVPDRGEVQRSAASGPPSRRLPWRPAARSRTGTGDPRAATRRPRGPRRSWQGASRSHRGSLVTNGPPPCGSPAALRTVLARLVGVAPADSRARKGGQALRARLGTQARATKGADATWRASLDHFDDVLEAAVDSALGDGFTFEVAAPRRRTAETDEGGLRYRSSRCSRAGSSSGASSTSTRPRRPSPLDSVELRDLLASQASHLRTFR